MKHKSVIIYLILFILIGIASVFILHHTKRTEAQLPKKTSIESFVHEATFTEYNKNGLIKTKIHTKKITYFEPSGTTEFEKPFIITYTETRREWHIRSDKGVGDKTGRVIVLSGHVTAHELPTTSHGDTLIKTSEMTIYPKESRAETNRPILLMRPGIKIHGKGFTANLKTGQYQLHSESEVIYQPNKVKKQTQQSS